MQLKSSWAALWMPLSIAYIAADLRNKNCDVTLIDCIAEKMPTRVLIKKAISLEPDIIIFNTAIPSLSGDMETAGLLKNSLPNSKLAVIGLYPTLYEDDLLRKFPFVDYGIIGEPEWVIGQLIEEKYEVGGMENIDGLIWRNKDSIIRNKSQVMSDNALDTLPHPARDLLNHDSYTLPFSGKKFTLIAVSRGCPFQCTFCVASVYYGKELRKRSVTDIINEIEECISTYDIKSFLFWGEAFTIDEMYTTEICTEIIRKKLKIEWSAAARVDSINRELLRKMKQAGCVLISLGIESVSQAVLDSAKKHINMQMSSSAITLAKEQGIRTVGHFIFGLPNDNRTSIRESIRFACRSGIDYAQFYCAVPYPKTEFGESARKNGWVKSANIDQLDFTKEVADNEYLTAKEIKKYRNIAFYRFYMRPSTFIKVIREIKTLNVIRTLFSFFKWMDS